jgi:hypothetical protein
MAKAAAVWEWLLRAALASSGGVASVKVVYDATRVVLA